MEALLNAVTAAAPMNMEATEAPKATETPPAANAGSRKTRPTHTAYQKTVMARCAHASPTRTVSHLARVPRTALC